MLACAIDSSSAGGAAVVDAYNTAGYSDVRDTVQVGGAWCLFAGHQKVFHFITQNVCPHTAMVVNGRISCRFVQL